MPGACVPRFVPGRAVQVRVSENYTRRNVLDLIKRQASSLFYKRDADSLSQSNVNNRLGNQNRPNNRPPRRGQPPKTGRNPPPQPPRQNFSLPSGTHFFNGSIQELSFLSTISFLSDFPGQVAVRYYVVQGEPGEDESLEDLVSSRGDDDFMDETDREFGEDPEYDEFLDPLEGDLYLYVEETNLFLSASIEQGDQAMSEPAPDDPNMTDPSEDERFTDVTGEEPATDEGFDDISEVESVNTMKLLGPLRAFTVRYRVPAVRRASEFEDEEEDWAEVWDVQQEGIYPNAVEFTLVFEDENSEDVDTEELEGIRLVIPVYDPRTLARRGNSAPF